MWRATLPLAARTQLVHGWPTDEVLLQALEPSELRTIITSHVGREFRRNS